MVSSRARRSPRGVLDRFAGADHARRPLSAANTVQPAVKVLYISGYPRSGSTLLERLLTLEAGVASGGELRRIWERGFLANELCSCGAPFLSCPFWTQVVVEAFGEPARVDVEAAAAAIRSLESRRRRWREVGSRARGRSGAVAELLEELLPPLYRAIVTVSGRTAVVDSSKDPVYALLLSGMPGIDLQTVHLIRDSRAVAYSWQRRRRRPEVVDREEYMPVIRPTGSAVGWSARNLAVEVLSRFSRSYTRVRYEDLVSDPSVASTLIGDERVDPGQPDGEQSSHFPGYHTVSGNPMRLTKGAPRIVADVEWAAAMPRRQRAAVTALTFPLLLRYRYPVLRAPARDTQ